METTEICEIDVATRRIVGGSDSPPELDSPCQVNTVNVLICVRCRVNVLSSLMLLLSSPFLKSSGNR